VHTQQQAIYILNLGIKMRNENIKKQQSAKKKTLFAEIPKLTEREVVDSELWILKALDYNIDITAPASLVESLLNDYRLMCNKSRLSYSEDVIIEWERLSKYTFSCSLASIALKPTFIAVFSLIKHEPANLELPLNRYLDEKFTTTGPSSDSDMNFSLREGEEEEEGGVVVSREMRELYHLVIDRFGDPTNT
jgi:hypothetical protein